MLKALVKKELSQLLSIYTYDARKGKKRSTGAMIAFIALMGFVFVSVAFMFFAMANSIAEILVPSGQGWLFFSMMGLMTILVGIVGSVFSTYSILYKAKDNELLLAMPIPPSAILFARMLIVYITSVFVCAIAWLPASVSYNIHCSKFSFYALIMQVLLLLAVAGIVTVLTSLLGWLIGLIARRLRSKTLVTVLLSLLFIVGYYYLYFRMSEIIKRVLLDLDKIEAGMHGWGWPLMQLGRGAVGELIPFGIFVLIAAVLFAILYYVLSKTLFSILTASDSAKKAVYHEKTVKRSAASSALLRRELKRFVSSPIVLLNTGFGILVMFVGTLFALIKADVLRDRLFSVLEPMGIMDHAPVIAVAAVVLFMSMDCLTSSSVSLEGKQIWILQTMPVDNKIILRAKVRAQVLLNAIPAAVTEAALSTVIRSSAAETISMIVCAVLFSWLTAEFGLMMNLRKPNLEWQSEAVPVKQGMAVMFTMLFGWAILLVVAGGGHILSSFLPVNSVLLLFAILMTLGAALLRNWSNKKGAEIFAHLC